MHTLCNVQRLREPPERLPPDERIPLPDERIVLPDEKLLRLPDERTGELYVCVRRLLLGVYDRVETPELRL